MKVPLSVLLLDDSEDDTLLLLREFERSNYDLTYKRVETAQSMRDALAERAWDIIVSDYAMPSFDALAALQVLKESRLDLPFIIVSGTIGEERAVEAMRLGAADFFQKGKLGLLIPAIEREINETRERRQRRQFEADLFQAEERFSKAFNASPIATGISTRSNNRFVDVNERFLTLTGYQRDEVIDHTGAELGLWLDSDSDPINLLKTETSIREVETSCRTKSGEIRFILLSLEILTIGSDSYILSMLQDITERKQAETVKARLASIVEFSNDAVLSKDLNGIILSWNTGAQRIYGYTEAEVIGKPISILFPPEKLAEEQLIYTGLVAGELFENYETLRVRKDGKRINVSLTISPIRDSSGNITSASIIARDITERRLAEERTQALYLQLEQRNHELIAIQGIGRILAATLDIEELYQALYREVAQKLLQTPHFAVALYDDKLQVIRYGYVVVNGEERDTNEFSAIPFGTGPVSHAILLGEAQIVDLSVESPRTADQNLWRLVGENKTAPQSALYVPLITTGKVLGVMEFQHPDAMAFATIDVLFISTLANQAAIALTNAQFYEAARDSASELKSLYNATSYLFKSDSVLNLGYQIVQAVVQEFGKADCGLIMFDKQENSVIRVARSGSYHVEPHATLAIDGPGLIPEALRTGNTIYAPDVTIDPRYVSNHPTTQSELVIPLRSAAGIIGALDLQSIERNAFSERDLRILQAFAERVSAAIENMQLYEELNHYAGELEWRVAKRTAELHRAKERVEAILSNSSDAIVLTDERMIIHQANPAFNQLFGQSPDEVFGKPLSILFQAGQEELLTEVTQRILETLQSERVELIGLRKDGTPFNADIALAPTLQQDSEEARLIYSMRDITALKEIEKNLRRSLEQERELGELKSRFVSMASHEFRTPLATVQSSSDLLMLYHDRMTEAQRVEHLAKIQYQVKHLTGLIDDILTLYKAESVGLNFNPVPIKIESFTREIVSQMQAIAPDHTIHVSAAVKHDLIQVDEKLMRQAITNLLSNAIKYSRDGGSVHLTLDYDEGERLSIQVRDEGIGIPQEDQNRLFQSFHRAKNVGSIPGTGLGLAIVKQAVEAHGGRVLFESEVGVGTTFTIVIPIHPDSAEQPVESTTALRRD